MCGRGATGPFGMKIFPERTSGLSASGTARARGLEILHYDRDFDTIARYTGQPARWIVPPGTV